MMLCVISYWVYYLAQNGGRSSSFAAAFSPERKAPQSTREYAAHRLDTVLDKFLKTMQTTADVCRKSC